MLQWERVDEGWGRRAVEFAVLCEPHNCREYVAVYQRLGLTAGERVLDGLTDDRLAGTVTRTEPGWPRLEEFPVRECLLIVLNEEWEHRNYSERDLAVLEERAGTP